MSRTDAELLAEYYAGHPRYSVEEVVEVDGLHAVRLTDRLTHKRVTIASALPLAPAGMRLVRIQPVERSLL
jgi:hypothetical protein